MTARLRTTPVNVFRLLFLTLSLHGFATHGNIQDHLCVQTPLMTVCFTHEGNILSIDACFRSANGAESVANFSGADASPLLEIRFQQSSLSGSGIDAGWCWERRENDSSITVRFSAGLFVKTYLIRKNSYSVDIAAATDGPVDKPAPRCADSVQFNICTALPQDGELRRFAISKRNGRVFREPQIADAAATKWVWHGVRSRFWTAMIKPSTAASVAVKDACLSVSAHLPDTASFTAVIYTGPIVFRELKKSGHECTGLIYPLWFWMRWLSLGLQYMFDLLLGMIPNTVLAIAALSVCVKIIVAPLFRIAHRWQKQVNAQKSLLQPRLDEINKNFKGEERNRRTLEAYKELEIHPLYSLKSLLSAAIQIPIFFAAYHMLSEHIALAGAGFLWIGDLSVPDRLFRLPFSIPWFGGYFNLLPCIMTAITVAASWIHPDRTLTPQLLKKQRQSLYFMAGLFFILLYTSSAGMVIYWTMNNILAFFAALFGFISHKRHAA